MTVTPQDIDAVSKAVSAQDRVDLKALRAEFSHLAFTACDASDVDEDPLTTVGRYDLHLIDASDHCVFVTSDAETATGVMLAARRAAP